MHRRLLLLLLLMLPLALTACNLTTSQNIATATPTISPNAGSPIVTLTAPADGAQVKVSELVLVRGVASDAVGVTSIRLLANGQPVQSKGFNGEKNVNFTLDYTPVSRGEVTLTVLAFRNTAQSDPVTVKINVGQSSLPATVTPAVGVTNIPTVNPNDPTCRAQANAPLNIRALPTTDSSVLNVVQSGTLLQVTGRLGDNTWWQVRFGTSIGWASAQFTTLYGANCVTVPVININTIITPTPAPITPTATVTPSPTSTPGTPDLVITRFDGPDSIAIPMGESSVDVEYSITVTNTGSAPARNFDVSLRAVGADDSRLSAVQVLRRGESILLTFTLTFSAAGSYTVIAEADPNGVVPEISEANNLASRPLVIITPR